MMPRSLNRFCGKKLFDLLILFAVILNIFYIVDYKILNQGKQLPCRRYGYPRLLLQRPQRGSATQDDDVRAHGINNSRIPRFPKLEAPQEGKAVSKEVEEYHPKVNIMPTHSRIKQEDSNVKPLSHKRRSGAAPCPVHPSGLAGDVPCQCDPVTPESLIAKYPFIEPGGRIRPRNCAAEQRIALIIPYSSSRDTHLHILLANLVPLLYKQQVDVTIFVVEQVEPKLLNRGLLYNIGVLESLKVGRFNCFIFHEVEVIPRNEQVMYRCDDKPRHFPTAVSQDHGKTFNRQFSEYFGGVVSISKEQYQLVNGFSNLYFGWGGQDDDLLLRVKNKKMKEIRVDLKIGHYQKITIHGQEKETANPGRYQLLKSAPQRQDTEGLKTTKYKLLRVRKEPLYTWISVSVDMKQVFATAPEYTLQDLKKVTGQR